MARLVFRPKPHLTSSEQPTSDRTHRKCPSRKDEIPCGFIGVRPDRPVSRKVREPLWKSQAEASPPSPPRPPVTIHWCLPRDVECPETEIMARSAPDRPSHDWVLFVVALLAKSLSVSTAPPCRTPRRSTAKPGSRKGLRVHSRASESEKLISPLNPPSCMDDLMIPKAPWLRAPARTSTGMHPSKRAVDVPLQVWMWIP